MVSTRRTIPTSFHGAWINVATRSGYFRAVDWADFILFVIPTLVAERVRDQAARKALLDLVQTCNLLMSWELSAEEQTLIKTNLVAWNACLEASLAKRTGNWRVLSSETAPKLEATALEAGLDGCVIDSAREACRVRVPLQVDVNSRRIRLVPVHLKNGFPITSAIKPKTVVVHVSDIVKLVGLVP
ncbi:hypothetical protein J3Q64DRAFT_1851588 [Phycomyces blakesleeanus]|uniref:PIN domain-containing protein n=1 Tax=Phycomyces blakesleeanus TaxID=4837 RepID=A0ABR3ARK2_PHYBL